MSEFSVDVRGVSKRFRLAHGKPNSRRSGSFTVREFSTKTSGPSRKCPSK